MEYSVYSSGLQTPPKKYIYLVQLVDYQLKFFVKKEFEDFESANNYFKTKVHSYKNFMLRKNITPNETIATFYVCSYFYGTEKISEVSLLTIEV